MDAFEILVIILSCFLAIFLILAIIMFAFIIVLIKKVNHLVDRGDEIVKDISQAASSVTKLAAPLKVLTTILKVFANKQSKGR
jgi:hypothetical protein